jgi:hypothetical protein
MLKQFPEFFNDLKVFTAATDLDLHVTVPQCRSMLEPTKFCPILRKLHLIKDPKGRTCVPPYDLGPLAQLLTTATKLTAFWVDRIVLQRNPDSMNQLLRALKACRGLQELRMLGGVLEGKPWHPVGFAHSVLEGSHTLRTLHCEDLDDGDYPFRCILLMAESRLSQLQSLGVVRLHIGVAQAVEGLARLTQLTHLSLDGA